jgi:hypothetical protein
LQTQLPIRNTNMLLLVDFSNLCIIASKDDARCNLELLGE